MLKVRVRPDTGSLEIYGTVTPAGAKVGIRVRHRAGSDDPQLAAEEARTLEAKILKTAWHGERPSTHSFAQACRSYLTHETRSDGTKALVRRLVLHFRDISLGEIDQEAIDRARRALLRHDASAGTVRRNLIVPLRAIMSHAARRNWCTVPALDVPPEPKGRTRFFVPDEAQAMIERGRHLTPLLRFLFCSGARLGEALGLTWDQVDLRGARAILWEGETKSGARRVIKLPPAAVVALAGLPGRTGRVFRDQRGEAYRAAGGYGGQVKKSWATTLRLAGLAGFTPHHTRHTWASWHYALHRDLILLQQDGGWSDIDLVVRYSHLMPSGHEDGIRRVWGILTPVEAVSA